MTTTPTVTCEIHLARCDACNVVRSVEMMPLHLEAYMGFGQHTETTGYTVTVRRYSQPADFPIPHNARIVVERDHKKG